jgi:hypothetical protein
MPQASSLQRRGHRFHLDPSKAHQHDSSRVSPSASTLSRQRRDHAVQVASGRVWWAEVEDVRARIERRRAVELAARQRRGLPPRGSPARRTVTITGRAALPGAEMPVRLAEREASAVAHGEGAAGGSQAARLRPRPSVAEWLGTRPDRVAAWAVALGFLLVLAAILSSH